MIKNDLLVKIIYIVKHKNSDGKVPMPSMDLFAGISLAG
jgi:hypothetical protein